ncbi:SH3 domain-containing protein [Pseudomonas juntendi]|uniref:SH3 domain-containing protein n=1 Tax=Pseudomonas TaxID=286 RepID=UPI0012AE76DF|nr:MULTISPECIES: SH3 domain-containing protein [Pseudomonas]MDG9918233.1 SH3 domain-containing protein [Pseudomonas juntendi]MDH0507681.1 SH3 domain-containing protein [Pseudomonas juntendi]MDH1044837.1 SH3 domain-containing protein [Pseudomonas juntendi]MRT62348.1 SH3 domain-containing protein [Pseudomonas sp. CAH-1]
MRKSKAFAVTLLACSIAFSSGCANMNKQQMGTMIGGGAGALAGSLFGSGTGKIVAVIAGGLIGSAVGNAIGKNLDEQDRVALEATTQRALSTAKPNSITQWRSPTSGAVAAIHVGPVYKKTEVVEVKRLATVQPTKDLQMIRAPYVTLKSSNVRNAPSTSAEKVASLQPGIEFQAIGATGDWILVGRKGVNVGYVHKTLVTPAAAVAEAKPAPTLVAVAKAPVVTPTKPAEPAPVPVAKLDEIDVAKTPALKALDDAPAAAPAPVAEKVVASSDCRDLMAKIRAKTGETEDSKATACKQPGPAGAWANI